jgi:hypothetical protein
MHVTGGSMSCLILQRTGVQYRTIDYAKNIDGAVRAYLSRMASLCKGPRVGRRILCRYRTYERTCGDRHRYHCRELLAQSSLAGMTQSQAWSNMVMFLRNIYCSVAPLHYTIQYYC